MFYSSHSPRDGGMNASVSLRVKVLMTGDSGVGKSSLLRAFTQHSFDENIGPTIGMEFLTKVVTVYDDDHDGCHGVVEDAVREGGGAGSGNCVSSSSIHPSQGSIGESADTSEDDEKPFATPKEESEGGEELGDGGMGGCSQNRQSTAPNSIAVSTSANKGNFPPSLGSAGGSSINRGKMGVPICLQLWDTAGQERFRTLASVYYRNVHAVVLVYDVNEPNTFHGVRRWLKEAEQHLNQSGHAGASELGCESDAIVYLLIGNKVDLCEGHGTMAVDPREGRAFAVEHRMMFALTSAKTEVGVEQAFDEVARAVYTKIRQRHVVTNETKEGKRVFFNNAINQRGGRTQDGKSRCC